MKRVALFVAVLSMLTGILSACNTVQGFGKDIEKAGSKLENAAKK